MKRALAICGVGFAVATHAAAQGTFQNLDFESAMVPPGSTLVPVSEGLPGWQVHDESDEKLTTLSYNAYAGSSAVLLGPDAAFGRIEGNFTLLLMGGVRIVQIGDVPNSAQSLLFKANNTEGSFAATLGGNSIAVVPLEVTPNYVLYGGDISSFAEQTTGLSFSSSGYLYLDSITFSSQAIPEPTCPKLLCWAGALVALWKAKQTERPLRC